MRKIFWMAAGWSLFSAGGWHGLARAELMAITDMAIEREIRLKPVATVSSQSVCLQDLAEDAWLQTRCRFERDRCCLWSLGGSLSRTMTRAQIQRDLRDVGITGFVLRVLGPESVEVSQTHRSLSSSELEEKLRKSIAMNVGDAVESVRVSGARVSNPIYVPLEGAFAWDVELPESITRKVTAKIIATGAGAQPLGWISADVSREVSAYVAKRTIRPGEEFKDVDFELRPINALGLSSGVFGKGAFPSGRRAQRSVLRGAALTGDAVEKAVDVRLGDAVTLILKSDNLSVTTKGISEGSGAKGDTISVQVLKYNRAFRGRLVGGRTVEVWL